MQAPTAIEKRRLFEGHALFGKLAPDDLDALLSHARVEHFPAGREIFAKGSPGRSMMAILAGSVRISAPTPAGHDIVLAILNSGEVFGEIAVLDGQDRTADATAIADSYLLVLDHRDFMPFLERRADLCILFLKLLCQRLRLTDRQVAEAMFGRLEDRMAKALVRLAGGSARAGHGAVLRLSQQELAGMVGATRESVNKQLQIWQGAGKLRLGKRLIEIPDLAAIEALT
ncbi:MAG TPA: Crp/Fnr family transcriptional regulator [Stellaceae bacterium]|nr:Crp/Fnr family transcriptional regulator [Stellaceae bacterium]